MNTNNADHENRDASIKADIQRQRHDQSVRDTAGLSEETERDPGNMQACSRHDSEHGLSGRPQMSDSLLFPGSTRTGAEIALFNLPKIDTCPGASALCIKHCYVKRSNRFPQVKPSHQARYEASLRDDFVEKMVADVERSGKKIVRIHTSGDFYRQKYIADWVKIIRQTPSVAYYSYTRSWRINELRRNLDRLRRLPNMQLWWSSDKETGVPPEGRVMYMSVEDSDVPGFEASLVFRVKQDTVRTSVGGIKVCPLDIGSPEDEAKKITCAECRICFSQALV